LNNTEERKYNYGSDRKTPKFNDIRSSQASQSKKNTVAFTYSSIQKMRPAEQKAKAKSNI
jgi:hypothetical protein